MAPSAQFYRTLAAAGFHVSPSSGAKGVLAFLFAPIRVDLCLSVAQSAFAILPAGESMTINTVIVDDERPAREELLYLLKGFPELNVVALGKNGLEAVALVKEHDPG